MSYSTHRARQSETNNKLLVLCVAVVCLLFSPAVCQTQAPVPPATDLSQELKKYPGLLPEFRHLVTQLQRNVESPPARHQSNILPLLPAATTYYLALPNYGEAAQQALFTFRDELQQSAVLREWWRRGDMAKTGPEIESFIEKFSAVSGYLGDEIVISGVAGKKNHEVLLIADVRKSGLKEFLQQILKELPGKSRSDIRVLGLQELASAKVTATKDELIVVVRPDFVLAAQSLDAARDFNQVLDAKKGGFAATEFGQRIAQSYRGGTVMLGAGDLHSFLSEIQKPEADAKMLERSGFSNVKYLIWGNKRIADRTVSETELSFVGPRRGPASWLAAPAPLGSLDYVSPKAAFVLAVVLKNPAEVFDDIKELATASNPNAFATIPQMEQALQISLRDDLLGQLQGEVAVEISDLQKPEPAWNAILRVNDRGRLQRTLAKLFAQFPTRAFDQDGVHYDSLTIPSKGKAVEVDFAFTENYLIVGPSRTSIAEAIGFHKSGESLAKSAPFLDALPPGSPREASAMFYEDASALAALQMRRFAPDLADMGLDVSPVAQPIALFLYGENNAIRAVSGGKGSQVTTSMIVAAIAVPNLLRARIAANEASAVSAMRAINTAQISYAAAFPERGYARDMVSLGPNPGGFSTYSPEFANLIAQNMVANCIAKTTCTKDGYVFTMSGVCEAKTCRAYVLFATPLSSSTGTKSYCLASDGVVRVRKAFAIAPVSEADCRNWDPLQ